MQDGKKKHNMIIINPYNFKPQLKNSLISAYEFDETSGGTLFDSHGNNDGTNVNGVTINEPGVIDRAYLFNSTSYTDYNTALISGFPFSFSIWINSLDASSLRYLFASNANVVNKYGVLIGANSSGISVIYGNGAGVVLANELNHRYNISISNNTWYHVVVTANDRTNSDTKVYVNSSEISWTSSSGSASSTSFGAGESLLSAIWMSTRMSSWYGSIDQTSIWSKVLTPAEILHLYNSGAGLAYSNW